MLSPSRARTTSLTILAALCLLPLLAWPGAVPTLEAQADSFPIITVAGDGTWGYGGDGGSATDAQLGGASDVALDAAGNLYIADPGNNRIRKVDTLGVISTVAGNGTWGYGGDGGPATEAPLGNPRGIAVDASGNLFIADMTNHRIRKVDHATGVISTVAGSASEGGFSGDGGPATSARLWAPLGVAVNGAGEIFIADTTNQRVRRIDSTGVITTVVGTGDFGYSGDGGPATAAQIWGPSDLSFDAAGNLYIADEHNNRIRKVDTLGVISTVAGDGTWSYGDDGGPATAAQMRSPAGVALDELGNLYIADQANHRIRKVDHATGMITTVAGTGTQGYGGDGGPATSAMLSSPSGLVGDGAGNLFIADTGTRRVRKLTLWGKPGATTAAATGVSGSGATLGGTVAANGAETSVSFQLTTTSGNYAGATTLAATPATISGGATAVSAVAGGLSVNTSYYYRLVAVNRFGTSYGAERTFVTFVASQPASYLISTVAGTGSQGYSGDGGPATSAQLWWPIDVAPDTAGQLFIADWGNHRIRKLDRATGLITTVAGTGTMGFSGDGGPASAAQLWAPSGVVVDAAGNLLIADTGNQRIRKVTPGGLISTVAGNGTQGFGGDGGPATSAQLNTPRKLSLDSAGNLLIADEANNRIRKVDQATGLISTVAGTGTGGFSGDGGPAAAAQLWGPSDLSFDAAGNLYIADWRNHRIRRVDQATGVITTVAGDGAGGNVGDGGGGFGGDGGLATQAHLDNPAGVALDAAGNLFIADTENQRIRRVDHVTHVITTVAGSGTMGFGGDDGPATAAQLFNPYAVTVDAAGTIFIADFANHRIRQLTPLAAPTATTGAATSISHSGATLGGTVSANGAAAGVSFQLTTTSGSYTGATVLAATPATVSGFATPVSAVAGGLRDDTTYYFRVVATNSFGTTYGEERSFTTDLPPLPTDHLLISTVAGSGAQGFGGDGGPATAAQLNFPGGVAVDGQGNLFVADIVNHRVRKIDSATGQISTVAGTGTEGYSGDGGPATSAQLYFPNGLAVDGAGNLFIADEGNHRVRKVNGAGVITTVAGTGVAGDYGDGGPAGDARLWGPSGVAVDSHGNLFIADTTNGRVRKVNGAGVITTVAGSDSRSYSGDGGPATSAGLSAPAGLAVDRAGNLYIADFMHERVRKVDGAGVISTVAGTGVTGSSGDGGPASAAQLSYPLGLAVNAAGELFIVEKNNQRVRRVDGAGVISTVAGDGVAGFGGDGGLATEARLNYPTGLSVDRQGNLYLADQTNHRVRKLAPVAAPTATTGAATEVSGGGATLGGTVAANGAAASVSFQLSTTSGSYAAATELNAAPGTVTGRRSVAVSAVAGGLRDDTTYYFRMVAANSLGTSYGEEQSFTTGVGGGPTISLGPTRLPSGKIDTAYSQQLSAVGGTAPYSFTLTAGSLPMGLSLGADGALSGTPTISGSFELAVTASDANGLSGSGSYTLLVRSHPEVTELTISVQSSEQIIISGVCTPECSVRVVLSAYPDGRATGLAGGGWPSQAQQVAYQATADHAGLWSIDTARDQPLSGSFPAGGFALGTRLEVQATARDAEGESSGPVSATGVAAVQVFIPLTAR